MNTENFKKIGESLKKYSQRALTDFLQALRDFGSNPAEITELDKETASKVLFESNEVSKKSSTAMGSLAKSVTKAAAENLEGSVENLVAAMKDQGFEGKPLNKPIPERKGPRSFNR